MKCEWHCCSKEVLGKGSKGTYRNKRFCSKSCSNSSRVARNRRRTKERAVELLGGKCVRCGYNKCLRALQFHHLHDKQFGLAAKGHTHSWEKVKAELSKCILLCSNCHAEEHDSNVR